MSQKLGNPAPPNLPLGPDVYDRRYQDQLTNVLRLYFNQLGGNINTLIGTRGGQYLNFPFAAVQRTTDVTFAANTATLVTFDSSSFLNGCTNISAGGIRVAQPGIYNYQFSAQLANTGAQIRSAWVWLRVNGVDVPGSASEFDVGPSHAGGPGYVVAAANLYVRLAARDTVELWAAVSATQVTFDALDPQTSPFPAPSAPSVRATLSFVSSVLP